MFSPYLLAILLAPLACGLQVSERGSSPGAPAPSSHKKPVNSTVLQSKITLKALEAHAHKLENFAYATPERNRLMGGKGSNDSIQYVQDTLKKLGDYYEVTLQPFSSFVYTDGDFALTVDGQVVNGTLFSYSPNGNVTAELVPVSNFGCETGNFPPEVSGKIALISRGTCDFGLKVALASTAGASAVIIYNNANGTIAGTLGAPGRPEGDYVPALAVTKDQGVAWAEEISGGTTVTATVVVDGSVTEVLYTNNVVAETRSGDKENVLHLGAHLDSVSAGPGINDNGSGSIALLEIAKQLASYSVKNSVRFSWWSGEEEGLVGSTYWVDNASEEVLSKIRLYLNFDMIASPNYGLFAYDGDGSTYGETGPAGSAEAEKLFHDYFASIGVNSSDSEFTGRSDYGPFLDVGIPCGGLDTGAEGTKTEEQASMFGGTAGEAYDHCYHQACDNFDNLALDAFIINSKAIAHAVATYATSFDSLPPRSSSTAKSLLATTESSKSTRVYKGDLMIM